MQPLPVSWAPSESQTTENTKNKINASPNKKILWLEKKSISMTHQSWQSGTVKRDLKCVLVKICKSWETANTLRKMLFFFCINIPGFKAFHILKNYLWAQDEQSSCKAVLQKWEEYFMQPKNKKWSCLITQFLSGAHKEKLLCSQRLVFLSSCGTRAEPDWVWIVQEMLKEHGLRIATASLAKWVLLHHWLDWSLWLNSLLPEVWWGNQNSIREKTWDGAAAGPRKGKAGCSSSGAWGRQSGTAAWLSPACRTSHVCMRLLGSKWFLGKVRVLLTQKK